MRKACWRNRGELPRSQLSPRMALQGTFLGTMRRGRDESGFRFQRRSSTVVSGFCCWMRLSVNVAELRSAVPTRGSFSESHLEFQYQCVELLTTHLEGFLNEMSFQCNVTLICADWAVQIPSGASPFLQRPKAIALKYLDPLSH